MRILAHKEKAEKLRRQFEEELLAFSLLVSEVCPDDEQTHRFVIFAAQCLVLPHPEHCFNGAAWRNLVARVEGIAQRDAQAKLVDELLNRAARPRNAFPSDAFD